MNIYHLRKYVLRVTNINFRQTLTCINNKEKSSWELVSYHQGKNTFIFQLLLSRRFWRICMWILGLQKFFSTKKVVVLVLQPSEIPFFICTPSEKVCQWKKRRVYWPNALPVGAESFPHCIMLGKVHLI